MRRRIALAAFVLLPALAARAADLDAFARQLEGGWNGRATITPAGPMPFVFLFDRQEDGSLLARTSRDAGTWIELRLARSEGAWTLVESAAMPELGVQSHALSPAEDAPEGVVRFVTPENPSFLVVDFTLAGTRLLLDVKLRGEDHARYELDRLPEPALPGLRALLAAAAVQAPAGEREVR